MREINQMNNMIESALVKSNTLRGAMLVGYWEEIVGNTHTYSEVAGIKEKILYVRVGNSSVLHHMNINQKNYIEKINHFLKGDYIEKIVFKLGKINIEQKLELEKLKKDFQESKVEKRIIPKEYQVEKLNLEESIEYLAKESKKREEIALTKGYIKCKKCKSLFSGKGNLCPSCKNQLLQIVLEEFGREHTCPLCREQMNRTTISKIGD